MLISEWLQETASVMADSLIPSARLDAEIILAHTLNHPRTWLHAHGDESLDPRRRDIADARVQLRLERVPIAYIIGHKEFYGRQFFVSPATLIPRPDSEALIDLLKKYTRTEHKKLVDIGAGSGCLGITAKLEIPRLDVALLDTSKQALNIAEKNAEYHDAKVRTSVSNLLDDYPLNPDIVLANLPYVDTAWQVSPETKHEPQEALYANKRGLALIEKLILQAKDRLKSGSLLILEADPRQHDEMVEQAEKAGFGLLEISGFGVALKKL